MSLSLDTKFQLGSEITSEQRQFLNVHGFLHFKGVLSEGEVEMLRTERDRIEQAWIKERRKQICGIPVFYGRNEQGDKIVQRMAFASRFSKPMSALVRDSRFEPIRKLVGPDARVGEDEKDGVVINRYLNVPGNPYRKLGWHTDGLRDLFYLRMPQQMLNFGLHLDSVRRTDGGLRLIPGSHDQGFLRMCFEKMYFVSHKEDPREVCVETDPGDLTIHDGRLWHRVAQSSKVGASSVRRTIYVPFLSGPYEPKTDAAKTPAYHHLSRAMLAARGLRQGLAVKVRASFP